MMYRIIAPLMILALSVRISSCQEINSTLHLTEYGVPYAFVGETVTFTCQTERSNLIGWSSKEYIGVNRLDFASVEPDGTMRPPTDSGAVAQLIRSYRVDGTVVLVSQLQITVQSVYQVASVTCHNIGINAVDTISFHIAGNTSITCDTPAICPGKKVSCACTTAHSNTLAWSSDQLIGEGGAELMFSFNEPFNLLARKNASNMNTSAVLSDTSEENGVSVLKSELSFTLPSTSNSFDIVLTCENVDLQSSYSIILPIQKECTTATTVTISADPTTTMDESITTLCNESCPTPSGGSYLFAVVSVTSVMSVVLGVIIVVSLLLLYYVLRKTSRKFNGDLQEQPPDGDPEINSTSLQMQSLVVVERDEQAHDFKELVQRLTNELQERKCAQNQLEKQIEMMMCEMEQQKAQSQEIDSEMKEQQKAKEKREIEMLQEQQLKEQFKMIQYKMEQQKAQSQEIESEMARNRDHLHVAHAGNLKGSSVPDCGSGYLDISQKCSERTT